MTETADVDPDLVDVNVTCHTAGCSNADITIVLSIPDGVPVACGVCGQPIDDVLPVAGVIL